MAQACPVCDSASHTLFTTHERMELFTCGGCGTIYMWPLPSAEVTEALYEDAYEGATAGYFGKVDKKMRRCRRRLAWLSRFQREGRFLDIGCNGGFIAEAAREKGFEAHGLDIDPVSIAYAKEHYPGNTFFLGTTEQYADRVEPFDLIYSSEVIEHVPNVQSFVAAAARLLKPGGYFFITTPDISHWRRPKDLVSWDGFAPPSHCIYFNPKSLRGLLARHGLEVVRTRLALKPGIKMLCRKIAA